ncbi:aromatic ring-opening dioxygenase LigA [Cellulomonas shaoxiangyii]|uniref:Aromatic ring-opening dioxygenase LigA n=1 Tax=Cellulomonas shaoxiangyii TaxID=2566013 RepID=A0A4P7SKC0_9CELL|nr:aromatic ring-opening dioxygenase LigA [Cellulomonas shaoxiangyii]QCB92983.1 aromatic ring-opening dioxygenase LigA [Cellulomonas shaoxiangyii]TGY84128.1 aromatic ring-opening dioxygenase LigA [Cellulomonas shaoxiangyii]
MSAAVRKPAHLKALAIVVMAFGMIFAVAGTATWALVSGNLRSEQITVSEDAAMFGGELVDTPWEAWAQADIINHHALDASGGKTYSQLDKEDPVRETMMNGSFLRASLFTSVVAFGVALLVFGLGVVFIVTGEALRRIAARVDVPTAVTAEPVTV